MGLLSKKDTRTEIFVHVKQEPRDITVKRRVDVSSDGLKAWVIIDPETPTKAGWKIDVTDCIRYDQNGPYVEAIRGASKAIKISLENKDYTFSKMTNDEMKQFVEMKIFKAHYGSMLKDLLNAIKPILIILAVVVVVSVAISAYNAYELSKIPAIMYPVPAN